MTEAGRIIGGKYRLRKEIGVGAMGSVWSAVHETLGRTAAVKFLHSNDDDPETASARFVAEARMAAAVKHRFIVDIFDFGITEDGLSYMVLELLDGEELGELLANGPPLQVKDAVRMIAQCLSGLEEVHKAGIIHRDLKPENIFLMRDSDGIFPKLLDFGISKMRDGGSPPGASMRPPSGASARPGPRRAQLTAPGTVLGTPWYMAPEQLRGLSTLDERVDIYAMGVILFELLVGRVPFEQENTADLLLAIMSEGPADLMLERPELGEPLADLLAMAMAIDPAERYASAHQMRRALEQLADSLPQAWTIVQSGGGEEAIVTGKNAAVSDSIMPVTRRREVRAPQPDPLDLTVPVRGWSRGIWAGAGGTAVVVTLLAMGLSSDTGEAPQAAKVPATPTSAAAPVQLPPSTAVDPATETEVTVETNPDAVATAPPAKSKPGARVVTPAKRVIKTARKAAKSVKAAGRSAKRKKFRSLDF